MAIDYLKVYAHLLPRARAWLLSIDTTLRQFVSGLSSFPAAVQLFYDELWADVQPDLTNQLPEWENQFALLQTSLSEADRRTRLAAQWSATGGQSPEYLQEVFEENGFSGIFVHEWFTPTTLTTPPSTLIARDPNDYISGGVVLYEHECSDLASQSQCSDPSIEDIDCGDFIGKQGQLLVNLQGDRSSLAAYTIPAGPDADEWRYFLYIGGETFDESLNGGPNLATVSAARKSEFEDLLLKFCPGQNWIGTFIDYT